jgi:hypothetical protein
MKKSVVNRTLQVASAVAVYSAISIWSSTAHVDIVANTITSLNSLLVILAIAVMFPYLCFNVLAKLYTPPKSLNLENTSGRNSSKIGQDELQAIEQDLESMQYRGTRYNAVDISTRSNVENTARAQPEIKYRGASIANISENSSQNKADSFSTERESQKSAKPRERIKYRGSYVD